MAVAAGSAGAGRAGFGRAIAYLPGMGQMIGLALAWTVGVGLCALIAQRIVVRLDLPWRAALMYFGVLDYPEEPARVQGRRA